MKKLLIIALVFSVLFTAACQSSPSSSATTQGTQSQDNSRQDQLYIEVAALGNVDYFYDHKMGMQKVGEELGVKTEYVGPSEYDMNAMIAAFEQSIAKSPNGIVVIGFEDSLNPIIKKSLDAGIPVVTVDADLPDSGRLAFVGTGNVNAGRMGGEALAELIGGVGKVAIMTKPGQSNFEERMQGYEEAFASYPGIEVVQIVDTQIDLVIAAQGAAALLQKYPDLAGIACMEATGGSGAATAVKEAGLQGNIKIIAMDRDNDVLNMIEEGIITATVVQQTALMPYYGTQILFNLANSKVDITSDNAAAGVSGIPSMIDTGVIIVDSSNVKYFKR